MKDKTDCIIIGGGIGGLFSGAFLARNGMNVTVLEKNAIIGGVVCNASIAKEKSSKRGCT